MVTRATPLRLVQLAVRGIALTYTLLLAPSLVLIPVMLRGLLLSPHASHTLHNAYNAVCPLLAFAPTLVGIRVYSRAVREFDGKHKQEQWSEEEMAAADGWLNSPVFRKRLAILKWTMMLITFAAAWRWHDSAAFSMTFCLSLLASYWIAPGDQLLALRKRVAPLPPRPPLGGWSGTIGRLHSDHWGGRPPVAANS